MSASCAAPNRPSPSHLVSTSRPNGPARGSSGRTYPTRVGGCPRNGPQPGKDPKPFWIRGSAWGRGIPSLGSALRLQRNMSRKVSRVDEVAALVKFLRAAGRNVDNARRRAGHARWSRRHAAGDTGILPAHRHPATGDCPPSPDPSCFFWLTRCRVPRTQELNTRTNSTDTVD